MRLRHAAVGAVAAFAVVGGTAQASLVVNWKLDEASGTTAADAAAAGGTQDGTSAAAAPQWLPNGGILGGALRFGATAQTDVDENVTHTAAANLVAGYPVTIASWARTTSAGSFRRTLVYLGNQAVGDQYVQTSLDPGNSATPNRPVGAARNTTFVGMVGNAAANDGAWHHVVATYASPTSRTLYVDGVQVSASSTSVPFPTTTRLSIGALMRNTPTDAYAGDIDDVGVWDEALTPQRVALINGLGRIAAAPLADPSIDQVEAVFNSQAGEATSGPYRWRYATGLAEMAKIGDTGTINGEPYIVLDGSGNGVRGVPEPGGLCALAVGGSIGLLGRRRSRRYGA